MRYVSTRGSAPELAFDDVLLTGLAPDGGLYVPKDWPAFSAGSEPQTWGGVRFGSRLVDSRTHEVDATAAEHATRSTPAATMHLIRNLDTQHSP